MSISNLFDTFLLYFPFVGRVVVSVFHHFKNYKQDIPPKNAFPTIIKINKTHPHTENQTSILFLETLLLTKTGRSRLLKRQILYNNLGGLGPGHLDEPALLRFEKTCSIDDRAVDLVTWRNLRIGPTMGPRWLGTILNLPEVRKEIPGFFKAGNYEVGIKHRK